MNEVTNDPLSQVRRSIWLRAGVSLVLFTLAFLLLFLFVDTAVKPFLANYLRWDLFGGSASYFYLSNLYLPLAFVLYLAGALLVMRSAITRTLGYLSELLDAVKGLINQEGGAIELSPELSQTALALTEIKNESERRNRAAKAAEERKNELVLYLAHDIKTPLTSIVGYLSILEESPDLPLEQRARYAQITLEKAYRLEALVNEFFEITRYNLHAISIEREMIDVRLLCQQVIDEFALAAEERSLTIELAASERLVAFVDGNKLARVLDNLIKNAISYAEQGTVVKVEALVEDGEAGRKHLSVSVENTGREIAPIHLTRLFDQFYRTDEARQSVSGGAGLGLAIAREIVQAHGGDIEATSSQGRTRFAFWVPLLP